jgi:hypothetical protein
MEVVTRRRRSGRALAVAACAGLAVATLTACTGGHDARSAEVRRVTAMLNQTQAALKLGRPVATFETRPCKSGQAATAVVYLYPSVTLAQARTLATNANRYWRMHAGTWGHPSIQATEGPGSHTFTASGADPLANLTVGADSLTVEWSLTRTPPVFLVGGVTGCEVVGRTNTSQ